MAKGRGGSLRPVQDVVSRIRYDATLDAARFVVGYEERDAGVSAAPLPAFVAGGDVPWHRVRYVEAGGLTVRDRQARVDLVFGSGDSLAADLAALTGDGEPRFVSDHFGVTALLQPSERTVDAAPVPTSALGADDDPVDGRAGAGRVRPGGAAPGTTGGGCCWSPTRPSTGGSWG
ncbi:DUF504 domain-containing protein [Dactylosporangium roseum]|uniref:DUF504 domain-containing protein n=1 Tax=Dactylosporangium roseum TaxID=47989 RepID=A0ABY5YWF8_9ACTN|nr:DUF504 domain-containing protein [Dactylosporangium roseum]UWZ34075.1 DUF504 domain-containing protein [Dactylosporangium roseum]